MTQRARPFNPTCRFSPDDRPCFPSTGPRISSLTHASGLILKLVATTGWLLAAIFSNSAWGQAFSATAQHADGGTFQVTDAANRLAAANRALELCRSQPSPGRCELTEANGSTLHTVASVRARVPAENHPLYLWEFQTTNARLFLAGSVHILKPGFYPLPRQYDDAFAQTDHLVLEVDAAGLSSEAIQQAMLKHARLPSGQTLTQLLPRDMVSTLKSTLAEYGLPYGAVEVFKPSYVSQQLALLALMSVGYSPQSGVEHYFRRKLAERQILELESVEFQFELLFNADMATQIDLVSATLEQLDQFEPITAALVGAWLAGDDGALQDALAEQHADTELARAFTRRLVDDRNRSMANTIIGYLNQGGSYFVLVGAAHLVGNQGIPTLLTQAGYPGRRVMSGDRIE